MKSLLLQKVLLRRYMFQLAAGFQLFIGIAFEISWDAGAKLLIRLPFGAIELGIIDMKPYFPAMRQQKKIQDREKSKKNLKRRQK